MIIPGWGLYINVRKYQIPGLGYKKKYVYTLY